MHAIKVRQEVRDLAPVVTSLLRHYYALLPLVRRYKENSNANDKNVLYNSGYIPRMPLDTIREKQEAIITQLSKTLDTISTKTQALEMEFARILAAKERPSRPSHPSHVSEIIDLIDDTTNNHRDKKVEGEFVASMSTHLAPIKAFNALICPIMHVLSTHKISLT